MPIGPDHAAHIGRVRVAYVLSGPDLDPDAVTRATGVRADYAHHVGDEKRNVGGCVLGFHADGAWRIESRVEGDALSHKDIDAHVRALLDLLLPHVSKLREWAKRGEAVFDVLWESSYLRAGTGPVLAPECVQGIAALGAAVAFDIVAIDDGSH
ncbi:MAG: DUF4279 domain-containing protein [Planctomycetes bacterium]|nr:DUF4279 domain-containing protein [Planctomycetota bacterium]MCC7168946.1 DUF4279 domain-containing protein [Planctomycetota bacterium]